jgi:hypothetical protein
MLLGILPKLNFTRNQALVLQPAIELVMRCDKVGTFSFNSFKIQTLQIFSDNSELKSLPIT